MAVAASVISSSGGQSGADRYPGLAPPSASVDSPTSMEVDRDRGPVTKFVDLCVKHQVMDLRGAGFFNDIRNPPQEQRDIALALSLGRCVLHCR